MNNEQMDNEKPLMTTENDQNAPEDRLSFDVIAAFADIFFPPDENGPNEYDPNESGPNENVDDGALSEADCQALAELGTSEELVARLVASLPRDPAPVESPADDSLTSDIPSSEELTRCTDRDETAIGPGVPVHDSPAFNELMARLKQVEAIERVQWVSSYRKLHELGRGGQGSGLSGRVSE